MTGSNWRFNFTGYSSAASDEDGKMSVVKGGGFGFPPGVLAVTLVSALTNGQIVDSDIFFHPGEPINNFPSENEYDFELIALHEMGHALGLDHNDNCLPKPTVMHSTVTPGPHDCSLAEAEISGVRSLYSGSGSSGIAASPLVVYFSGVEGGASPGQQTVTLTGAPGTTWSAAAFTKSGAPWLQISPTAGSVPSAVTIRTVTDDLISGSYSGAVLVASGGVAQALPVSLLLAVPALRLTPASLRFGALAGTPDPEAQIMNLVGTGGQNWTASASTQAGGWLRVETDDGCSLPHWALPHGRSSPHLLPRPGDGGRGPKLEVQHGFTRDDSGIAARGKHHPGPSPGASGRADARALAAPGNGSNGRAYSAADPDFRGVLALGGSRFARNRAGRNLDNLAAGRVQPGQLNSQAGAALHPPAFIRRDNFALHLRASRSDLAATMDQGLLQMRGECLPRLLRIGGQSDRGSHRERHPFRQGHAIRMRLRRVGGAGAAAPSAGRFLGRHGILSGPAILAASCLDQSGREGQAQSQYRARSHIKPPPYLRYDAEALLLKHLFDLTNLVLHFPGRLLQLALHLEAGAVDDPAGVLFERTFD